MAKAKSKIVNFSPNEAMAYADLNDIQRALTQRAWEWPNYSNVMTPYRELGGTTWDAAFDDPTLCRKVAFTKGAGLAMGSSVLNFAVVSGFLGIYTAVLPPAEFGLTSPNPSMRWACITNLETVAVTAAAAGQERYSLITASITDLAEDLQARHFKSAATGVKSSANTAKRRALTLTLGTEPGVSAAISTAVIPALPAGQALVAVVLASDAAITKVYDCTVPFGPIQENIYFPGTHGLYTNVTVNAGVSARGTFAASGICRFFVRGSGLERILRLDIRHALPAGAFVQLSKWQDNLYTAIQLLEGGVDFTADGTSRRLVINTLGNPISSGGDVRTVPIWGQGGHIKEAETSFGDDCLCVEFLADSGTLTSLRVKSVVG